MVIPPTAQPGSPTPRSSPPARPGPFKAFAGDAPRYFAPVAAKTGPIRCYVCHHEGPTAHQCADLTGDCPEGARWVPRPHMYRSAETQVPVGRDPPQKPRGVCRGDAGNSWRTGGFIRVRQVGTPRLWGRLGQGGPSRKLVAGGRLQPPPVAPFRRGRTTGCTHCFPTVLPGRLGCLPCAWGS